MEMWKKRKGLIGVLAASAVCALALPVGTAQAAPRRAS